MRTQGHDRSPVPDPTDPPEGGYTRRLRFAGLFVPGLLAFGLMCAAVLQGTLPVSAAMRGRTDIKLSIEEVSTYADGSFPRFFQTRTGDRRPVVAVDLHDTRAQGICASGRVPTPLGAHTLRITTRPGAELRLSRLQLALESIDDVELAGGGVALNQAAVTEQGIPVEGRRPGMLPIHARDLKLRIHGMVRWVTASGLSLSGVDMGMGKEVKECF